MISAKSTLGKQVWSFAAGRVPLLTTGIEPLFTSHDQIAVLNLNGVDADVKIFIFFEDKDPVGEYTLQVKSRRVKKVRFNDLINPLPVPLDTAFGFILRSDVQVIVQFSRTMTGSNCGAGFCVNAFHQDT